MPIVKYEIVNPVASQKEPYYDKRKGLFVFPVKERYTYYVECARTGESGGREYFILLGKEPFDHHVRKCNVDMYGKCKINVRGEIKDYIVEETEHRGNITIEYVESADNYDVYQIE